MSQDYLKFFYQNTRGLRSKIVHGLRDKITLENFDIIGLTETWLYDGIDSESLFDESYITYRCDRTSRTYPNANINEDNFRGGGALISLKRNISASRMKHWELEVPFDNVWVKINTNCSKKIFINCIYINHESSFDRLNLYLRQLNEIINIREPNAKFLILGDFNLSCIQWEWADNRCIALNYEGRLANELIDTLILTDLAQMNFIKYNVHGNQRILDLVLTNMTGIRTTRVNGVVKEDDFHPAFTIMLNTKSIKFMKNSKAPKYNFFKTDFTSINNELSNINWQELFANSNVNDSVEKFYTVINTLIAQFTPKISLKNNTFPKWFSRELIKMIHEKDYYLKMKKKTNNELYTSLYNEKRKQVKREKKTNLKNYQMNIESLLKTNPRCFFSYTKSLRKSNNLPAEMRWGNHTSDNMKDTVNLFAKYFSSVYDISDPSDNNPVTETVTDYLNFTNNDLLTIIQNMDKNQTSSPDGIPSIFFIYTGHTITQPLSIIFRKSLNEMIYPNAFKISFLCPIHKSGDIDNMANYRPISIIPAIAKIFDKLLYQHLLCATSALITVYQHGFISGKSTNTNLFEFIDYLTRNMMGGGQVDTLYMDLAKAFDKINHKILIRKLRTFPIHPCLIQLLTSYLHDRKQQVCIYGEKSDSITPLSSVPQGSVLSPLLFALFMNDLPPLIVSNILLFADDLKIFAKINTLEDARQLQRDIDTIINWCDQNKLQLNVSKCFMISFTRRSTTTYEYFNYNIGGSPIQRVNTIRDLGVLFDSKLSFTNHFENITKRAYRFMGFMTRSLYRFNNITTFTTLYNLYVRSILEYGSVIWNPYYQIHIDRLERVQKKFTRILFRKFNYPYETYNMRLIRLNLLSLEHRRLLADKLMLFKINNGLNRTIVNHHFEPLHGRQLRHNRTFYLPFANNNVEFYSPVLRMHRQHMEYFADLDLYEPHLGAFKRYSIFEIKALQIPSNYTINN